MADRFSTSSNGGTSSDSRGSDWKSEQTSEQHDVRIYDSRGKQLLSTTESAPPQSETAQELFGSRVALAYDGTAIYVAMQIRKGAQRSQTCFGRVEAAGVESLDDVASPIRKAVRGTEIEIESPDYDDLAAFPWSAPGVSSLPSNLTDPLDHDRSIKVGAPSFSSAFAVAEACFQTDESVSVTRNPKYVNSDSDRRSIDFSSSIVAIDDSYGSVTLSEETKGIVEEIRKKRREKKCNQIFSEVENLLEEIESSGIGKQTAQEEFTKRLDKVYASDKGQKKDQSQRSALSTSLEKPIRNHDTQPAAGFQSKGGQQGLLSALLIVIVFISTAFVAILLMQHLTSPSNWTLPGSITSSMQTNPVITVSLAVIVVVILFLFSVLFFIRQMVNN